jgi:prepilin-type N-terminal cleavage/methylation domain-containing protein
MKNYTGIKSSRRYGFTLIELAVVASVVGVLAAVLLNRVIFYQEQAEKAAMEQTVAIIRSALHMQTAVRFAKDRAADIPRLLKQNPMDWLSEKPMNYKGEYFAPKPKDLEPGNWYYDIQSGYLIYSIRNETNFHIDAGEPNQVRFRTRLVTSLQDDKVIEGTTLEPVVPYRWF